MGCGGAAAECFCIKLVALRKGQFFSAGFADLFGRVVMLKSGIPKCSNIKSSTFTEFLLESKETVPLQSMPKAVRALGA